jgi:hypothetical protein
MDMKNIKNMNMKNMDMKNIETEDAEYWSGDAHPNWLFY